MDASSDYPAFDGSGKTFAVYRTWNKALTALLNSKTDVLDDATINAALQSIYQNEDGIEVNLPHYYLDYYNFAYNTSAETLDQLPTDALFDLFGGERDIASTSADGAVYSQETLSELNNLAYNFFYTHGFQLEQSESTASDYSTSVGAAMAGKYTVLNSKADESWDTLSAATTTPAALEFTVTSSGPLWNAYMRYPVACDMGFSLEKVTEPSGGGGGTVTPDPDPDPGTDIEDPDTPLDPGPGGETDIEDPDTPLDPGTDIEDPDTPLGNLPQTGVAEAVNPYMTAGLMALAAAMTMAGLYFSRKRGKREDA